MTLTRQWIPSPNYSSRQGASVRLIVLHSAEGASSFQALGNYFQGNVEASSHVGIDNVTPGLIGEYVSRGNKAWHVCGYNSIAVGAEQCTPSGASANWTRDDWLAHKVMLDNAAAWVAEESIKFSIPLVVLTQVQAQGSGRGVCQHKDLGSFGCGHFDCGPNYPMDYVISKAQAIVGAKPPTLPPFPYPSDNYLGRPSSDPKCHSGCYGGIDTTNVAAWQKKMHDRGWTISADGCYGNQSYQVCRQFQQEKGLTVDGLVGPQTWNATWTAPVT